MKNFSSVLRTATKNIAPAYFHVDIDCGDPIYRERVYCYELYHQIRCAWPAGSTLVLHGELDKSAHPIMRSIGLGHAKPDLLIHNPGDMRGNDTIIEVKSENAPTDGIKNDLHKLASFLDAANYKSAIYLIYGHNTASITARIKAAAELIETSRAIELWVHLSPNSEATHAASLGKIREY